jgi:hypothetical protein
VLTINWSTERMIGEYQILTLTFGRVYGEVRSNEDSTSGIFLPELMTRARIVRGSFDLGTHYGGALACP